jgi:acetyltransferase-like isoleucine patch superfamily enzyme
MELMKKLIKKIFINTTLYQVISWAYNSYLENKVIDMDLLKGCGNGVVIDRGVQINFPERVILKDRVRIHVGTFIDSRGGVYIGEGSGLANNCMIITSTHRYRNAKRIPFDNVVDLKPVIIREFVWVGWDVTIMAGVEIGEGAIIGGGSVVTKNVPPLAIMIGNPAEVIGYRSKEHYNECKSLRKFQDPIITDYEENLIYMYKIRFDKELRELGLIK